MTHVTCRLTAKNRDQLRDPTLGNRVWATFTFFYQQHTDFIGRYPQLADAAVSWSVLKTLVTAL